MIEKSLIPNSPTLCKLSPRLTAGLSEKMSLCCLNNFLPDVSGDMFEDWPPEAATRCDKSSIDSDDAARRENVVGGSAMTSVRDHDGSSFLLR